MDKCNPSTILKQFQDKEEDNKEDRKPNNGLNGILMPKSIRDIPDLEEKVFSWNDEAEERLQHQSFLIETFKK